MSDIIGCGLQLVRRAVPNRSIGKFVFIVGAQKSGTTSLHKYLSQHKKITTSRIKELHFFNKDENYLKGLDYYLSHFPLFASDSCWLDSTPAYLYNELTPQRIYSFMPGAKIIIVLREPVSRAFSAYNMYKQAVAKPFFQEYLKTSNKASKDFFMPIARGELDPSLEYFLEFEMGIINRGKVLEEPALIRRGIYVPQIQRYVSLFGRENVMILFSNDLKNNTHEVVNRVLNFVGLDKMESLDTKAQHVREYKVDISGKGLIRNCAGHFFEKDKQELIERFDLEVPW